MDVLDGIPKQVLGIEIKSRDKIIFTFLLPASLELIAYLIQTLADIGVTIQLFRDHEVHYAWVTLALILFSPLITFILVVSSPWQLSESDRWSAENVKFLLRQVFNVILFPIGAIVRFCRRIFWSIEALFHDEDTYERHHSLSKAAETSPFELYRFVQAYCQAAPQVILQLFILLRKDIFRNYETTNVQVLSVVFSLVNIAVITMSYQRFESQKVVGRHYPWSAKEYVQQRHRKFQRTRSLTDELMKSKKTSEQISRTFPESEHIMQRFYSQHQEPTTSTTITTTTAAAAAASNPYGISNNTRYSQRPGSRNLNASQHVEGRQISAAETSNMLEGVDELDVVRRHGSIPESDWSTIESASVDDDGEPNPDQRRKLNARQIRVQSMGSDYVPDIPPPRPPASGDGKRVSFNPLNRLSQLTDRLVLNAEMYIKEHVPRPPRILIERALSQEERDKARSQSGRDNTNDMTRGSHASQMTNPRAETSLARDIISHQTSAPFQMAEDDPNHCDGGGAAKQHNIAARDSGSVAGGGPTAADGHDELDFFLPTRKKMIEGVEQDDFAGKFVSFFGWILFIYMRMISLSVFCVFYPWEFLYLIGAHYGLMLLCLAIESRLKDKCERIVFYFCLAYIYIFVILEFKIKFQHVRRMYIGYFLLVLLENFIITAIWYGTEDFSSWIYEYLFVSSMLSGGLTLMCMIVYYCILRPDDVILFEDVEDT